MALRLRGHTHYEYTNHLGNVLATTSDRKLSIQNGSTSYTADVLTLTDYYAFGQAIAARGYAGNSYRYGYNGKENDAATGWQDYGFRMYDPRICRFPSVDPLTKQYPELTPYQFASNTPIQAIDLDGLEMMPSTLHFNPMYDMGVRVGVLNATVIPLVGFTIKTVTDPIGTVAGLLDMTTPVGKIMLAAHTVTSITTWADNMQSTNNYTYGTAVGELFGTVMMLPAFELHEAKALSTAGRMVEGTAIGGEMLGASALEGLEVFGKAEAIESKALNAPIQDRYATDPLRKTKDGIKISDPEAVGTAHTQLGTKKGTNGDYRQARTFDANGNTVKDIDFTDHGRPQQHTNPHQHPYKENATGGTRVRGDAEPVTTP